MPEDAVEIRGSGMREAETRGARGAAWGGLGPGLVAAGTLCLVAAGGLLWWRRGAAVFEDIASAAIAWCF